MNYYVSGYINQFLTVSAKKDPKSISRNSKDWHEQLTGDNDNNKKRKKLKDYCLQGFRFLFLGDNTYSSLDYLIQSQCRLQN